MARLHSGSARASKPAGGVEEDADFAASGGALGLIAASSSKSAPLWKMDEEEPPSRAPSSSASLWVVAGFAPVASNLWRKKEESKKKERKEKKKKETAQKRCELSLGGHQAVPLPFEAQRLWVHVEQPRGKRFQKNNLTFSSRVSLNMHVALSKKTHSSPPGQGWSPLPLPNMITRWSLSRVSWSLPPATDDSSTTAERPAAASVVECDRL
jgi:hypothetical protein